MRPRPILRFALLLLALLPVAMAADVPAETTARDPIEGVWLGTIAAPQGTVADIGFEFFRTKHGTLIFKLNFPDMFTYAVPFMIPVEVNGGGSYSITPAFAIKLRLDGARLTGTFGPGQLPLTLKRGGQFPPKPAPPRHPAGPAPLWKFALGAGTWAPPVVVDDTIYLGTSAAGSMPCMRPTAPQFGHGRARTASTAVPSSPPTPSISSTPEPTSSR